jgi:hypothetical protein
MPLKERIVDLAALASLVSGCGTGTDVTSTTFGDGSTPPWDRATGTDTGTSPETHGNDDHGGTRGNDGDDGLDSTSGRPGDTTTTSSSSSGVDTPGEPMTGADGELPPIPDLGGGDDDGDDDDDDGDDDDDDDDAAATP